MTQTVQRTFLVELLGTVGSAGLGGGRCGCFGGRGGRVSGLAAAAAAAVATVWVLVDALPVSGGSGKLSRPATAARNPACTPHAPIST
jgi:hypothetical protein